MLFWRRHGDGCADEGAQTAAQGVVEIRAEHARRAAARGEGGGGTGRRERKCGDGGAGVRVCSAEAGGGPTGAGTAPPIAPRPPGI